MKKWSALLVASALLAGMLPSYASAQTSQQGEIKASVSFRAEPSTNGKFIRYLKNGEDVTIISQPNSYWYQVRDAAGKTGYVSSQAKYISVTSTEVKESIDEIDDKADASTNGEILKSVSFRKSASTSGTRIRYLSKGERVTVTGQPNKYWYEVVDRSGVKGFISADANYIRTTYEVPADPVLSLPYAERVERTIAAGMNYLGTPYEYGSDRGNTLTFDCSDFTRQVFKEGMGITLPSDSRQQGTHVKGKSTVVKNWQDLKRGDLMFFMSYKGTKESSYSSVNKSTAVITHVAIYLGDGKMLHTYSKESGGVKIDTIDNRHWEYRYLYGGSA
jgi:peptidoglycan DL-endopeptidase CwlO